MTRIALALLLSVAGCTETVRLDNSSLDELVSLEVQPANATVQITDLGPPYQRLQYSAIGHYGDGSSRDISDLVIWAIDRDVLGSVDDDGLFVASHEAAGYGVIAARIRSLQATTQLQVTIDATIIDSTSPPPGAGLFEPPKDVITGDPTSSPTLVYPSDGTMMPTAIASTLFQLEPGAGNTAFRITFESDVLRLRVETGADRWHASSTTQRLIAASAGPDYMRVGVEATAPGAPIYAGPSIALGFSSDLPPAPLYFWSAATNGIMRGGIDQASSSKLYPSSTTCVGCHAINRRGTELAIGVDVGSGSGATALATVGIAGQELLAPDPARPMGWAAYSPDGSRFVVANNGTLTQYESATGAVLGTVMIPQQRYATHPDWSPDGTKLAVALTQQMPTNLDVRSASIAVMPFVNGAFGLPQVIVDGGPTNNNYFPRWSPDGSRLAYVNASGASRGAASARLMLVPASGGTPQVLAQASHRVGTTDMADLANTMPAWGPRAGPRLWLAFSSARPYGKVMTGGPSQIWITSLDLSQAGDPSTPAFWLPCQDVSVLNYNPVWAYEMLTL